MNAPLTEEAQRAGKEVLPATSRQWLWELMVDGICELPELLFALLF